MNHGSGAFKNYKNTKKREREKGREKRKGRKERKKRGKKNKRPVIMDKISHSAADLGSE